MHPKKFPECILPHFKYRNKKEVSNHKNVQNSVHFTLSKKNYRCHGGSKQQAKLRKQKVSYVTMRSLGEDEEQSSGSLN